MTRSPMRARRGRGALLVLVVLVVLCATFALPSTRADAHTPHDPIGNLVLSPDFANNETIFVISQNRVLRSRNAGTTWRELNRGFDSNAVFTRFAAR